jgi:hypothetical protein
VFKEQDRVTQLFEKMSEHDQGSALPCYRIQLTDFDSDVNYLGRMRLFSFYLIHRQAPAQSGDKKSRTSRGTKILDPVR